MPNTNKAILVDRCEAAIELADQIGSDSIVIVGLDKLDGEISVKWNGIEGRLVKWVDEDRYSVIFDAEELLNTLKGELS